MGEDERGDLSRRVGHVERVLEKMDTRLGTIEEAAKLRGDEAHKRDIQIAQVIANVSSLHKSVEKVDARTFQILAVVLVGTATSVAVAVGVWVLGKVAL